MKVLECFAWIPKLWEDVVVSIFKRKTDTNIHIPNEIVFEILSRLPADDVVKSCCVCQQWKAIVLTSVFSRAHFSRASTTPIVFLQYVKYNPVHGLHFYFIDHGANKKNKMIKKVPNLFMDNKPEVTPELYFSYNGFLVFGSFFFPTFTLFICNPVTRELITLRKPVNIADVLGLYFHSSTREYRLICAFRRADGWWEYIILGQFTNKWRKLCAFSHVPAYRLPPVNVNGFIYWVAESNPRWYTLAFPPHCTSSIITFNTQTEKLQVMPHPGNRCAQCRYEHKKMQLLQMETELLFCRVYENHIKIWVLEDCTKWLWVERYNISLEWVFNHYPIPTYHQHEIKFVTVQNGELLLCWYSRGFFRYHLELKTFKKLDVKLFRHTFFSMAEIYLHVTAYTKSFESWRRHL